MWKPKKWARDHWRHKERCYLCHPWKKQGKRCLRPAEIRVEWLEREGQAERP